MKIKVLLHTTLVIVYLSAKPADCQRNRMGRTCTELKSDTLDVQCQRGFRKVSCDGRILPGTKGNLACKPGYQLHKDPDFTQVTCGDDGIWDNCLFSCEPECGNPTPVETVFNAAPLVTYLTGQYPWFATVYIGADSEKSDKQFLFRCVATIINRRMVLTTAHCIFKPTVRVEDYRVAVGSSIYKYGRSEDVYAQNFEVERILTPKNYEFDKESWPNNIGIVLIKGRFTFNQIIKPICLDRNFNGTIAELAEGGYLIGFDTDKQASESVGFAYNVTLASIANASCGNFDIAFTGSNQRDEKICAANLSVGGDIPFGFVGGGYFLHEYKNYNHMNYLKGIAIAYGKSLNFFGITNIFVHLSWILQQEKKYLTENEEKPLEFCGLKSRVNASLSLDTAGSCRLPTMPSNGRYFVGGVSSTPIVGSPVPEWSVLKYKCNGGYALGGSDTSFCNGGAWSNNPQCLRMCKPLLSISLDIFCSFNNEEVPCENPMPAGTIADINCKKGYKLHYAPDSTRRRCEEDGNWNASPFKCTPECGLETPKGHTLVIGGTTVKTGDFPWHAGIYLINSTHGSQYNKQICGGSILNAKMVLSAAHCFYPTGGNAPYDKSLFGVGVGKIYRGWSDSRDVFAHNSNVERLILPPSYDDIFGNYAQDIAIVVLGFSIKFTPYVRPVCIQWTFRGVEEEMEPGTPGIVAGWGLTSEGGDPSEVLQSVTLPSVPRYVCKDKLPPDFRPYLTHDKFCAGYQNGSSVCKGDSGGGLSFPQDVGDKTSVYYLRGVVSVGPTKDDTCDSKQYTVFTSVLANIEWLKNQRAHIDV